MAGPDSGFLSGNHRGRAKARRKKARPALCGFPSAECASTYPVVLAQCGILPRYGKPAGRPEKYLLSRLPDQCLRRYRSRHWCCRTGAGTAFHGRPAGDQDHYPFLRQADHRRNGEAVDRHLYAAEPLQPGNLFSGCIPCAKPLGSDHGQGAEGNHQERVLCVRLCAQPCSAANLRL